MASSTKNWDRYVFHAEEMARSGGFLGLKRRILELVGDLNQPVVADIGSGTGLLTLAMAPDAERVWAIDISERMCDYLRAKASSAELTNVETVVASAVSLPLVDESVDVVVSNYCFHHLSDADKHRAMDEAFRVLRPGGRFVFGDMMFRVSVANVRDRKLIAGKTRAIASRGIPGLFRIAKNGALFASGKWEKPARADWWEQALHRAGFGEIDVQSLAHEGGVAACTRPLEQDRIYRHLSECEVDEFAAAAVSRG